MKLCRFELREAPGLVRSGIVHGAKVYETDGANPIAVHEADAIRPLPPVGQPGSVRYFRTSKELHLDLLDETSPIFAYLNPTSIIGPSKIIPFPTLSGAVDFEPCIGAVMAASGANIPVELADDMILGYTLAIAVALRDVERQERALCLGPGRSFDTAIALGPVLTTPDELEETIESEERGKRFALSAVARVNGVELRRGAVQDLPFTFAEAIAAASESCAVREGDLILLGPLVWPGDADEQRLSPDDQVQCAVERLGTLSLKLAL